MVMVAAYFISFLYVGLRSFQQLNVMHAKYGLIPFISLMMAVCDYWVINTYIHQSAMIAIFVGLGGATGACLSVWAHNKWVSNKD